MLANVTRGKRWLNQIYEGTHRLRPPLIAGPEVSWLRLFSSRLDLEVFEGEFVSQVGFTSEVPRGMRMNGPSY